MENKPSGSKAVMPPRLLTSPENLKKITSLMCLNLPPQLVDRVNFKKHFSRFGKVIKTSISAAKNTATVYFDSHESAANAKQNGTKNMAPDFKIFWSQTRKSLDSESTPSKSSFNPEVEEELKSMARQDGYVTSGRGDKLKQSKFGGVYQPKRSSSVFSKVNEPSGSGRVDFFAPKPSGSHPPLMSQGNKAQAPFKGFDKSRFTFVAPKRDAPQPSSSTANPASIFGSAAQTNKPVVLPSPGLFQSALSAETAAPQKAAPPAPQQPPQAPVERQTLPVFTAQNSAQRTTLLASIKKRVQSDADALAVLEARDKLLRLGMAKSTDVAKAAKTLGVCNDMCPEKERFLRLERHQVSQYELRNGQPEHRYFVKQYARSSADQELPLAHELRTSAALRRTMDYLIFGIGPRVDASGEHLGDWFLYLWDRTRAIRKEVTQQQLCSEDAVVMLEQCARFHIACAARLAEQGVHDFDAKINTENLAKCLQTLKHLYHDMALLGKACPNEPEFQAYIVLLNLNTGDAIWEVQQLSPQVLASAPVQNAIKIYLALSTHNFVCFFKMVSRMGYFSGAILMRYFNQVRTKALEVLIRAHCQSVKSSYSYPLSDLVRMLSFEDADAATEFCQYHGLETSVETVVLAKAMFMMPETPVPTKRARRLVEAQLIGTFAEAIAGYAAQPHLLEPPAASSSFDQSTGSIAPHILKELEERGNAPAASITLSKNIFASQSLFSQPAPAFGKPAIAAGSLFQKAPSPNPMQKQLEAQSTATLKKVIDETVPLMINEITKLVARDVKLTKMAQTIAKGIFPKTLLEITRDVVSQELSLMKEEERARKAAMLEKQRREAQRQEMIKKMTTKAVQQIMVDVLGEETRRIAGAELRREQTLTRLSKGTLDDLLDEVVQIGVAQVAESELKEAQRIWRLKVQQLCDRLLLCRARRMLLRWRDAAQKVRLRRVRIQKFPAVGSSLESDEQIQELSVVSPTRRAVYSANKFLKEAKNIRTVGTQSTMPLVSMEQLSFMLSMSSKIPVFLFGGRAKPITVWRLVISVPDGDPDLMTLAKLCFAGGRSSANGRATSFLSNDVIMRFEFSSNSASCADPDAVLLIVNDENDAMGRLQKLLQDKPPVLVAIMVVGGNTVGKGLRELLHKLTVEQHVTRFCTFALYEKHQLPDKVTDALKWLAISSKNSLDTFVVASARELLSSLMEVSLWHTALMAAGPSNSLQQLQENPEMCIKLVNAAVHHLSAMAAETVSHLCREEEEYFKLACANLSADWNDVRFRDRISWIIDQQKLPTLNFVRDFLMNCSWTDLIEKFSAFCKQLPVEWEYADSLLNWVSHLLLSYQSCAPQDVPWANILASLLREMINCDDLKTPLGTSNAELMLVLSQKQLDTFSNCSWCPKDVLKDIGLSIDANVEEPATKSAELKTPRDALLEKMQHLMVGLEEIKAKRIRMDELARN